ncbi:MAG: hypothetical protein HUU25_03380 [Candidatus Sumerlaeia bacterium]|nr:hypothetical protein [Candidatus Sumerlaeia bacterium]
MIRLNLLPQDEKGRRSGARHAESRSSAPRTGSSPMVYLAVVPALLLAAGAAGYIYHSDVYSVQRERDEMQRSLASLRQEVQQLETQYANLREASRIYEQQVRVLDMLMPRNRILWSEKFEQMSTCIPDNVYLTRIGVDERVTEIRTPESLAEQAAWEAAPRDERGPAPAPVTVPSIIQTLTIEGIAFAEQTDQRIRLVLDFKDALIAHASVNEQGQPRRFMEQFADVPRIEYNRIRDVAGVNVNEFRMVIPTVDLATLGAMQSPAPPAAPPPGEVAQSAPAGSAS